MEPSIIAKNTKEIIRRLGYKQKAVAEKAGYHEKVFSNMLNNRKIIVDSDIPKIADALGVTPNDLFYGE